MGHGRSAVHAQGVISCIDSLHLLDQENFQFRVEANHVSESLMQAWGLVMKSLALQICRACLANAINTKEIRRFNIQK